MSGFEPRDGQRRMSAAVAVAIEEGGTLLAEAGTGTGKTLAYLIPAILSRRRVLVSTGTKNLQEQIFFKDLPALQQALGIPFKATLMKGRGNYLCLHRWEMYQDSFESFGAFGTFGAFDSEGGGAPAGASTRVERTERERSERPERSERSERSEGSERSDRSVFVPIVKAWAAKTQTGDRAELRDLPEDLPLWKEINAEAETCL